MDSIGWGSKLSRGNIAATATIQSVSAKTVPKLKGLANTTEPMPMHGSSQLPLTPDRLSTTDQYGHRTAVSVLEGAPTPHEVDGLKGSRKNMKKEPAPHKGSDAYSAEVMKSVNGMSNTMKKIVKNLPIAQAKMLEDAAKSKDNKAKWAKIVATLQMLEAARIASNNELSPEQLELAEQITQAVESGMVNLNLGGFLDPGDFNLTYIEPDPLGEDDEYYDIDDTKADDALTFARKEAKRKIVATFPKNAKLRNDAMTQFEDVMDQMIRSPRYNTLTQEELDIDLDATPRQLSDQLKVKQKTIHATVINAVIQDIKRVAGEIRSDIDNDFDEADRVYEDDYKKREVVEEKDNKEEKRLIDRGHFLTLARFQKINAEKASSNHYLTLPKLKEIGKHYGVPTGTRKQILDKLYEITDFQQRAVRGWFPKNDGLPEARQALNRPLDVSNFKPVKTPHTGMRGSGSGSAKHSTWRDKFT
jgi:hypothetical protein